MADVISIAANERGELTQAQLRVLHALAHGYKHAAAAHYLGISCRTVEQHVQQLRKVCKHKNLFQLGMWYQQHYPNGETT